MSCGARLGLVGWKFKFQTEIQKWAEIEFVKSLKLDYELKKFILL
jgi:hypothetical protein